MELERLYKSSTFLSKYEYLNNSYNVSNVDTQLILNHYKRNIKKYSNSTTNNFLNINTLKNELIFKCIYIEKVICSGIRIFFYITFVVVKY